MSNTSTPHTPLTKKDFESGQTIRWCPGCGDYAILAQTQKILPELHLPKENIVFISGIGCSSRFPYYMDTYGIHSIHGRAPALATGLRVARPDLKVFVITGDGDGLSIGGNHLIHLIRRNVDLTVVLFNNRIYGLTKGQYSPTSTEGTRTKSSPQGSIDHPFNPLLLALGAEASFVARAVDTDQAHLGEILTAAANHPGTSFVEVLQNCPIFNDGIWDHVREKKERPDNACYLVPGQPLRFGPKKEHGIRRTASGFEKVDATTTPEEQLYHYDPTQLSPTAAFELAQLTWPEFPVLLGVFRQVQRPVYEEQVLAQVQAAKAKKGQGTLRDMFYDAETWTITE